MSAAQPDLFGGTLPATPAPAVAGARKQARQPAPPVWEVPVPPPAPVVRKVPVLRPPQAIVRRRTIAWEKRLERSAVAATVQVTVSTGHHGVVLERLIDAEGVEAWLYATGVIEERGTGRSPAGRTVFCTPDQARQMHARQPLVGVGQDGTISMRLRFAAPGEATADTLPRLAALRAPVPVPAGKKPA